MTSELQPLNQEIIKNFKVLYRKEVVRRFLRDAKENNPTKIHVLEAMWMASKAWTHLTEKTIESCFRKSGFKQKIQKYEETVEEDRSVADTPTKDNDTPEQ